MKVVVLLAALAASVSSGFASRVVCYYTNWSRFGTDPFKIEDVNSTLCTHVVYSFLGLEDSGSVKSVDPWNDFGDEWTEGGLKKFVKLRNGNPSVKLLIGVGGWNEGPVRFQSMVRSPEKRKNFLISTLAFVQQHNFDGLEIDWIHQGMGGNEMDKLGFSELLKEMKPKYEDKRLLLSIATSANPTIVHNSYDIATLSKHVDILNVMTYDFHGSWDHQTGHVAPLRPMKSENPTERSLNVECAVNRYINFGASPEKLTLSLVAYGRTFTLLNKNYTGFNVLTKGPGKIEPLPYRTFCLQDKSQMWNKLRNEEQAVPYAISGDQWVGYEDVKSLKDKVDFSKTKKLGGVSFWSLDLDDFRGACGAGKYPLLTAVKEQINKN